MKPLEGIQVIELASMLAGPMCGRVLAEWGADVIKVETFNGDACTNSAAITPQQNALPRVSPSRSQVSSSRTSPISTTAHNVWLFRVVA